MSIVKRLLLAVLLVFSSQLGARAQLTTQTPLGVGIPNYMTYCLNSSSVAVPCPVGGSSSPGAGGAVSQSGTWQVNLGYGGALVSSSNPLGVADLALDAALAGAGIKVQGTVGISGTLPAFASTPTVIEASLDALILAGALQVNTVGGPTFASATRVQIATTPTAAPVWSNMSGCMYNTTLPTLANGQAAPCQADTSSRSIVALGSVSTFVPVGSTATGYGATPYTAINAASSTLAASIKASAGQVYGYDVCNGTSGAIYWRLFNLAAAPTVGTSTPVVRKLTPAGQCSTVYSDTGIVFATGIAIDVTTGSLADSDTTAITTANQVVANVFYK